MFYIIDSQSISDVRQCSVGCIEEHGGCRQKAFEGRMARLVARCQAALAVLTHCLSCAMARRTDSSSEESMMGFRPRPERVFRPLIPSAMYRFTQAFTDTRLMSVCAPALADERPSAFSRTARQRMRKQCFSPKRNPLSSSRRCASVNSNTFVFPISHYRTEISNIYFI